MCFLIGIIYLSINFGSFRNANFRTANDKYGAHYMYYYQNTLHRITCVHALVFQDQTPLILIQKEYDNQPARIKRNSLKIKINEQLAIEHNMLI